MFISHLQIMALWPTAKNCSESTGLSLPNIEAMRHRKKIPHAQFTKFVMAAKNDGFEGVTLQILHDIADNNISEEVS